MISYYNIPSNNRELQLAEKHKLEAEIITYQVITGNYSHSTFFHLTNFIITYQVITGNYSGSHGRNDSGGIITYQVITGNYSRG